MVRLHPIWAAPPAASSSYPGRWAKGSPHRPGPAGLPAVDLPTGPFGDGRIQREAHRERAAGSLLAGDRDSPAVLRNDLARAREADAAAANLLRHIAGPVELLEDIWQVVGRDPH